MMDASSSASSDDYPEVPQKKKKKRPYHRKRRTKKVRSTPAGEHVSVMPLEVFGRLQLQPGQTVVDCTLGYAGHAVQLLRAVAPQGRLVALDLDGGNLAHATEVLTAVKQTVGGEFQLHHANFAGLHSVLAAQGIEQVDAILADLGMSSMQVDDRERGFSFLRDGPLDMRMDRSRGRTAAELLMQLSQEELAEAFYTLGDEPEAGAIAAAIVAQRQTKPIERTRELTALIEAAAPVTVTLGPGRPSARRQRLAPLARVFQALRMLVNREAQNLQSLLRLIPQVLKPGGRVVFLSFHSGEDRLVKAALREGVRLGIYRQASNDPVRPTPEERLTNPRSRSAKLRWAIRA